MQKCLILPLFLLCCCAAMSQRQHVKFEQIGIRSGLSSSDITCILQDKKGFMWFGTIDGLNKYDGYSFTVFKNIPGDAGSLSNNYIRSIAESKNGDLWIGTLGGGLCRYDRQKELFTTYSMDLTNENSLSSPDINRVFVDSRDQVWIGTMTGLDKFDHVNNKFTHFTSKANDPFSLSDDYITDIAEDAENNIWIGTLEGGLNRYDVTGKKFSRFVYNHNEPETINSNHITTVFCDSKDRIWVGTEGKGLNLFNKTSGGFMHSRQKPNEVSGIPNTVQDITEDAIGNLWLITENEGVTVFNYDNNIINSYQHDELDNSSLGSNSLNCIYTDKKQNIWIGTYNAGIALVSIDATKFTHYKRMQLNSSLSNNNVLCIYEDIQKNIWIGTDGGGLNLFNPRTGVFTHYRHQKNNENSLAGDHVLAVCNDSRGNLWVGTWGKGITVFDKNMQVLRQLKFNEGDTNGLSSNNIWTIFEDSRKNIWIGTYGGGLNLYDPAKNKFTRFQYHRDKPSPINDNWINSIFEDSRGNLWVGTSGGGLLLYDPEKMIFTQFIPPGPQQSNINVNVCELFEDRNKNLWIGTVDGLYSLDVATGKVTTYKVANGLPGNIIYGILEDDYGMLWVSTNKGLSRFNRMIGKFTNFTTADGLQSDEFKQKAYCISSTGEIYFGGNNGFNKFYPENIRSKAFEPPLVITNFQVFNKKLPIEVSDKDPSPLKQSITETKSITLSYRQSVFSIEFATLNYTANEKKLYAYMLEGFDKDWNEVGTQRTATYTNLDPGKYVFKVRGLNNDGTWSPQIATLEIEITPPFWLTWWFRISVILFVMGIVFFIYRLRVHNIKKQKLELEQMVKEQTIQLLHTNKELEWKNRELEQFAYVASHDLQEPIRTTSGFAELLQRQYRGKLDETADKYLQFIGQSSERMKVLITDLLDYSRIGRKKAIGTVDCNIVVKEMLADIDAAIKDSGACVQADELPVLRGYGTEIKQLFQNLVLNSIKFTEKGVPPHIKISSFQQNGHWQFAVSDNGIGIAEQHRERIFNIFQRLHTRNEYPGSGIGLSHCKKIVELHNGKIWVESAPVRGSIFHFTIQKNNIL